MSDMAEIYEDMTNPLDSIEEIMAGQDWVFDRPNHDELQVRMSGAHGQYAMTFIWQEQHSAMQFFCELDLTIPAVRDELLSRTLRQINEKLWLGHFDVPRETGIPFFRHTSLFKGMQHSSGADQVADLIEIALAECERFYNVFLLLSEAKNTQDSLMSLALSETRGEA